jgi:transcriptional regulator with XRE-family HTH domain
METTREPVTNGEFARAVGVHFTMASRYRNGQRIPSTRVLQKISEEYGLPIDQLVTAATAGGVQFGHYMRFNLFGLDPVADAAELDEYGITLPEVYSCPPI